MVNDLRDPSARPANRRRRATTDGARGRTDSRSTDPRRADSLALARSSWPRGPDVALGARHRTDVREAAAACSRVRGRAFVSIRPSAWLPACSSLRVPSPFPLPRGPELHRRQEKEQTVGQALRLRFVAVNRPKARGFSSAESTFHGGRRGGPTGYGVSPEGHRRRLWGDRQGRHHVGSETVPRVGSVGRVTDAARSSGRLRQTSGAWLEPAGKGRCSIL